MEQSKDCWNINTQGDTIKDTQLLFQGLRYDFKQLKENSSEIQHLSRDNRLFIEILLINI